MTITIPQEMNGTIEVQNIRSHHLFIIEFIIKQSDRFIPLIKWEQSCIFNMRIKIIKLYSTHLPFLHSHFLFLGWLSRQLTSTSTDNGWICSIYDAGYSNVECYEINYNEFPLM